MNAKISILLVICLLASVVPVYGASLSAQWTVEDKADGIAIGSGGEVYVNINQNHKVVKYSPEGVMLDGWTVEGEMTAMAIGPNGLVYVSFTNGLIQVFEA